MTDAWALKWTDLFVNLLYEIAQSLGYKQIDKTQIRESYAPVLYENLEKDNVAIRKGLIDVLTGQTSIRVAPGGAVTAQPTELTPAVTAVVPVAPKG